MKTALIDADSIIYILAWNNREHEDEASMELQVDQFMTDLVVDVEATHYMGIFSDKHTFRNDIYPLYKANRKGEIPPYIIFWKHRIIRTCIEKYQFFRAEGLEADDVLSIMRGEDVVYCSPDKDLKQIPGTHYNYAKKLWDTVSEDQASITYWTQVLTGDSTDNIPGCPGIGPVNAAKLLAGARNDDERRDIVLESFNKKLGKSEGFTQFELMCKLIRLLDDPALVPKFSQHVQAIAYSDALEEELNIQADGFLPSSERSHQNDVLRPATDLPE